MRRGLAKESGGVVVDPKDCSQSHPNLTPLRPLPLPAVVVYFHSSVGAGLSHTDLFISWAQLSTKSKQLPRIRLVPNDQDLKMLQFDVHISKFLGPNFEIWEP